MEEPIQSEIATWLADAPCRIGQVHLHPLPGGGYRLGHERDRDVLENAPETLESLSDAFGARSITLSNSSGDYRPLKTSPDLKQGWRLDLDSLEDVHQALDLIYPGMLGAWARYRAGILRVTPLRETLERQTGMYKVARTVTDEDAQEMIGRCCSDTACLKTVLWPLTESQPFESLPVEKRRVDPEDGTPGSSLPMLCSEACCLVIAEARRVAKSRQAQPAASATSDH